MEGTAQEGEVARGASPMLSLSTFGTGRGHDPEDLLQLPCAQPRVTQPEHSQGSALGQELPLKHFGPDFPHTLVCINAFPKAYAHGKQRR